MSVAVTDPLSLPAHRARAHAIRRRWQVWRSPAGQPSWARPVLLGIAAAAALLYAWNITRAGYAPFYSVAVKSMSESWEAFLFGAFDPKATITIDKLAGSFLPQALSARIFGYHPWSLALPQVIEGVVAVLVMYRVVRRWAGVPAGLLAAGIFALTPIAASMFGHSMEDGALTMCLVLAADAYQRAVTDARLRSLVWAGVWVGLGFQAKMLQAWMVLPALAAGYLLAAPVRLRRRLWQLGVAAIVMLAVSLSWVALYTFTPARDRPYVDGSTDNSAIAMVFGYNGLERFGITVKGAVTTGPGVTTSGTGAAQVPGGAAKSGVVGAAGRQARARVGEGTSSPPAVGSDDSQPRGSAGPPAATGARAPGTGGTAGPRAGSAGTAGPGAASASGGPGSSGRAPQIAAGRGAQGGGFAAGGGFGAGWTKLLGDSYAPQIGWLYPLALLALVFGLAWTRRAGRTDRTRAGLVMWGGWLLTYGLIFSKMSTIPHTAYVASLAPPLAALPAAGIVMFWRAHNAASWRRWVLPAAVAVELAWAVFVWRDYSGFLPWARTAAAVAGAAAVVVLAAAGLSRRATGRLITAGLTAGVAAMLAAPAAWAASVLDVSYAGSSFNASAGPSAGTGPGSGAGIAGGATPAGGVAADHFQGVSGGPGRVRSATGGRAAAIPRPGSGSAGGMMGATTSLTASEQAIYDYVAAHRDRAGYLMAVDSWEEASPYILATGQEVLPMGGFSGSVPEPTLARVRQLVSTGQLRFFLLTTATGGTIAGSAGGTSDSITAWVRASCTRVPAADYGASTAAGGSAALYYCRS